MDWFKHMTGSHDDPDFSDAWDEFGDAGPVVFWTTLEVYGREFSSLNNGWLTLSIPYYERKMRRKWKKMEKILTFFQKRSRIYFKKTDLTVSIHIPKFIEIASNWTKRPKRTPTEAPTEEPTEAPTAIEVEEEKETPIVPTGDNVVSIPKPGKYTKDFIAFWSSYPRKVGKDAAWKAWKRRNGDRPPIDDLLMTIQRQARSPDWLKDNGQFIPYPATWINQGRWADEVGEKSPSW